MGGGFGPALLANLLKTFDCNSDLIVCAASGA
jgi:hypothetical protein